MKNKLPGLLMALLVLGGSAAAHAQLNNKAFSFNTPSGGVGMSMGGRQAILNNEILGLRPKNLVRGTDGQILDVTRGPGHSAIVSEQSGAFLPSFKGSSYKGDNAGMSAGAFNSYFVPRQDGMSAGGSAHIFSGATVSTWTGRVVSGAPVSYLPDSSVDNWTGMVY